MFELCDDDGDLVGEYDSLTEAREAKEVYQDENLENNYTIYKVIRTRVG